MNFLGEADPEIISRNGVYYCKDFEASGTKVKVIFLDTRSHRDMHYFRSVAEIPLPFTALISAFVRLVSAALGISSAHPGDILGAEQWNWLESALAASQADVHLVVSSIQIVTCNPIVESWGHFPLAKSRLLDIFRRYDPPGLLLISGDVHHAEISSVQYTRADGQRGRWFEVTSSGLTHTCQDNIITGHVCPLMLDAFHAHREGTFNYLMERNFGLLSISQCDGEEKCHNRLNASAISLESEKRIEVLIEVGLKSNASPNPILSIETNEFPRIFETDVSSNILWGTTMIIISIILCWRHYLLL